MVQKFTLGQIKNSRLKIHGLKIHMAYMGGPVWACLVGMSFVPFFHVSKPLQSNGKQTTPTTAKDIFFIVFSVYRDTKTKAKKANQICLYI